MSDLNSVSLCGRLTRDQELKYTNSGDPVGNFSIAVNETKNKNGQKVEYASFFEIVLFGKVAEALGPYLLKGKQVNITGRLKQDRWEKDGRQNQRVNIIADSIQLLGGNSNTKPQGQNQGSPQKPNTSTFDDDIAW